MQKINCRGAHACLGGQLKPEIAYWLGFNARLEINFEANSTSPFKWTKFWNFALVIFR